MEAVEGGPSRKQKKNMNVNIAFIVNNDFSLTHWGPWW